MTARMRCLCWKSSAKEPWASPAAASRCAGELLARDEEGEEEEDGAEDDVSGDDAHGFGVEIGGVGTGGFHLLDLGGGFLDAGEDEPGADEDAGDGAGGIKRLGEIKAALAGRGVSELRDEGVACGFQDGLTAARGEKC